MVGLVSSCDIVQQDLAIIISSAQTPVKCYNRSSAYMVSPYDLMFCNAIALVPDNMLNLPW